MKYKIWCFLNATLTAYRFAQLKRVYFHLRHKKFPRGLNFKEPITFNEKINFLKIYNTDSRGSKFVDKIEVKSFIEQKIGSKYLIPTIETFENIDDISWEGLPESFVLKATHSSGMNFICEDKKNYSFKKIRPILKKWLDFDYCKYGGEWQYNLQPRIICEAYLENTEENSLLDYRFFCFNGEPKFVVVDIDTISKPKRNVYDLDWNLQDFQIYYPNIKEYVAKPKALKKMIELSKVLSESFIFVRVDFFYYKEKIYFGEITFHPAGGCQPIFPYSKDVELGGLLEFDAKEIKYKSL